jgi:hypothetical protein
MPSYAALKVENFPLSKLTTTLISPLGVYIPEIEHPPVMAAQANFIEGGLLLTLGVHHSALDASAVEAIIDVWAQNTAAAFDSTELKFSQFEPQLNDRSPLMSGTTGAKLEEFPEYYLKSTAPSASVDQNSGQKTSIPSPLPPMISRIFYFSPSSLAELKEAAAAYSTNDALTAFLWRHMVLARNPVSKTKSPVDIAGEISHLLYAANIRSRTTPPLPKNYLGNAFIAVKTEPLRISTIISEAGLSSATSVIRQSLAKLADDPNRISLTIGLMEQYGPSVLKYAYNGFFGPDVMATSWKDVAVYDRVWGDLGRVESFRVPGDPGEDGTMAVLPRLKDGGLEVRVALETEAMGRLMSDKDFIAKAELWA